MAILSTKVAEEVGRILAGHEELDVRLNASLRLLAEWRATVLQHVLIRQYGSTIQAGPFAGMKFLDSSADGCHVPKLLGIYEQELHDIISGIATAAYDVILNIGCAEGYYAAGLKRLAPMTRVLAYDASPLAQEATRRVAALNNLEIEVSGTFEASEFARYADHRVLVLCDIEGGEVELLDPQANPALAGFDLVVELHATKIGPARAIIPRRFASTHTIELREARGHDVEFPEALARCGHLDQLLAQWEWRSQATPWAVMRARRPSGPIARRRVDGAGG